MEYSINTTTSLTFILEQMDDVYSSYWCDIYFGTNGRCISLFVLLYNIPKVGILFYFEKGIYIFPLTVNKKIFNFFFF